MTQTGEAGTRPPDEKYPSLSVPPARLKPMSLRDLSPADLDAFRSEQQRAFDELAARNLKLDLTRGKPAAAQLDLSDELLSLPGAGNSEDASGTDVRNYGGLTGLPEIRAIFAELLGINPDHIIAADNSSLSLMHDTIMYSVVHGTCDSTEPWDRTTIKFLCPVPGYDRHFAICEHLGIEMIPVPLGDHGPDLEQVQRLAADESVKGMWVVPMYANPTGSIYDQETVRTLVSMPAAADFRIYWDNAYAFHHLTSDEHSPIDVLGMAREAGNPNRVLQFASTSKITYAGAGVSFLASSTDNLVWYQSHYQFRSIGPDKVNHLRHVRYLKDAEGVRTLMRRHRDLVAPKFQIVLDTLQRRLQEHQVATWTHPEGGYFITVNVPQGTATRVVGLAKQAGIALTPAGAAHPYRHDRDDSVIRIAPTFPPEAELAEAMEGFATCVLLAAAERLAD